MKYDHSVKIGGVWYKAGEEIPSPADASVATEQIKVVETIEEETKPKRAYNRKKAE